MGETLVFGELALDTAVGEARGQLLEVVQDRIGLGPEGILAPIRMRTINARARSPW